MSDLGPDRRQSRRGIAGASLGSDRRRQERSGHGASRRGPGLTRYLAPALLVLLAVLALLSLRGGKAPPVETSLAPQQPRYVLRGAEWRRYDPSGQPQFEGRAANIDYFDDDSARMNEFEVTVLAAGGAPWKASAPQGYAPPDSRHRIQLLGGVEGEGRWPDGEPLRFRTPQIWVDSEAETIETSEPVELLSATRTATGVGLKVNGMKQRVSLLRNVEMRYAPR